MFRFLKKIFRSNGTEQYPFLFDINLNISTNMDFIDHVSGWLNENIHDWTYSHVWLYNPVDGDILIYRIHFANLEELTYFKLWYKQKGEL